MYNLGGNRMFIKRKLVLMGLAFSGVLASCSYKPLVNKMEKISDTVSEMIFEKSNSLLDKMSFADLSEKRNLCNSLISDKDVFKQETINNYIKRSVLQEVEIGEENNQTNLEDGWIEFEEEIEEYCPEINYCEAEYNFIYNSLETNEKQAVKDNLENIPELEYLYDMGELNDFSFKKYIENCSSIKDNLENFNSIICEAKTQSENQFEDNGSADGNGPKHLIPEALIAAGVSEALMATIIGSASTASASIAVPIVGWILCAAAITALLIVIACNWETICNAFDAIINYLCEQFSNIADLIVGSQENVIETAADQIFDGAIARTQQKLGSSSSWSQEELKNALSKAIQKGATKIDTENGLIYLVREFMNKRPNVYLGKFIADKEDKNIVNGKNYIYFCEQDPSGLCFNFNEYNDYKDTHDMWYLNAMFLEYCIGLNCIFKLCSNPDNHYKYDIINLDNITGKPPVILRAIGVKTKQKAVMKEDDIYANELQYIHTHGYNWKYEGVLPVTADHLGI